MIRLYDYWRSSAAYRVRIALNLKGAEYERVAIDLKPGVDAQQSETYRLLNPQMRVPSIEVDGEVSGQSMAILEWIEETLPGPALLPKDPWVRLRVRAFADTIACDVHPLNNLSVLAKLRSEFAATEATITTWYHDWIRRGFDALEALIPEGRQTRYLFSDTPTFAEIALVPQVYNARRFDMDLAAYPKLLAIDQICRQLPAFEQAAPVVPA